MALGKWEKNASLERCARIGRPRVTWLVAGGGVMAMKWPVPIGRAISSSSTTTALTNS